MNLERDPLQDVPVEKWSSLQEAFKNDWPRGITGYYILDTQKQWMEYGIDFGFKLVCPFGDSLNGVIAINAKDKFYEMFIECPSDDTTQLEAALIQTKVIDWKRTMHVLFASSQVEESIKRIAQDINVEIVQISSLQLYILDAESPIFDISLPPDITFELLTSEHIELVDSTWPHRYPGSDEYFNLLIQAKSGYGLFRNKELIAWVFVKEMGALGHLFTVEEHRREGYGEVVLKLLCNTLLRNKKDIFSFCIQDNVKSCKLHEKLGFRNNSRVSSIYLKSK